MRLHDMELPPDHPSLRSPLRGPRPQAPAFVPSEVAGFCGLLACGHTGGARGPGTPSHRPRLLELDDSWQRLCISESESLGVPVALATLVAATPSRTQQGPPCLPPACLCQLFLWTEAQGVKTTGHNRSTGR